MFRFGLRGERASSPRVFAAAPLDIREASFAALAAAKGLSLDLPGHGQRVRDIYLNDPALQEIYPLGLLPLGQLYFLDWLVTHGRADQRLTDAEIYAFLRESAEDETRGACLTYLLQPRWQESFPFALTTRGWEQFRNWVNTSYGDHLRQPLPLEVPPDFSKSYTPIDGGGTLEGANILGHFCNPSGLQQAALSARAALERAGLRTSCRDVPVPRHMVPSDREQWLGLEIFPVTILTQAATPYFESGYDRGGLLPGENVYRIAYWNWELENVPDEWVEVARLVDEIWSPTEFVAKAMRARMAPPVYHMLPGVEVGPVETIARASLDIPEDHFLFLFMFDLHSQVHRKNPEAVFRAFRKAFRDDDRATLLIKTTGGDIHSADLAQLRETVHGRNVILLDKLMTRSQAYGLIAMSDCFVSLHRSEGFGLGLAEAMLLAKPVIATGYSGNLDFMNRENSLLVDYELTEINEDRPIYTRGNFWAEPSIEQGAAYMREVYEHQDDARARAARAQPGIQRLLSLDSAGKRMRLRLDQIAAGWRG
jgi:glycosyltransferase involved in cell wall biosynthesis